MNNDSVKNKLFCIITTFDDSLANKPIKSNPMTTKFISLFILICIQLFDLHAQDQKALNISSSHNSSLKNKTSAELFIEKNSNLLIGFEEEKVLQEIEQKGYRKEVISEILNGKKVKFIENQLTVSTPVSLAVFNKTLSDCDNLNFSYLNFTNWNGGLGTISGTNWDFCPDPLDDTLYAPGFMSGAINLNSNILIGSLSASGPTGERQVLLNCANCHDTIARNPITGAYEIPYLAPNGSGTSVRLGNAKSGGETERLTYKLHVTPANNHPVFRYAIIYENPTAHALDEQPFFMVNVTDSLGNFVSGCGAFCLFANANDPDFVSLNSSNIYNISTSEILYKKWSTVAIDFSTNIGNDVYLEFTTGDCALTGHWGYAYIDAGCDTWDSVVPILTGDTLAKLTAPLGYMTHQWFDPSNNPVPGATNDTLFIQNPVPGTWKVRCQAYGSFACYKTFEVKIIDVTGIVITKTQNETFYLYPNPTKDYFNLKYNLEKAANVAIVVTNLLGEQLIKIETLQHSPGIQKTVIDTQKLESGIYFVTLDIDGTLSTQKISIHK